MGKQRLHKKGMTQSSAGVFPTQPVKQRPIVAPPIAIALGLLGLFVLLLLARVPFLSNPLIGEESYFAFLAINNGVDRIHPNLISHAPDGDHPDPTHEFLFYSRINGKIRMGAAEHPVPPYLFITRVMRSFSDGAHFNVLSFDQKSRIARLRFFYCFGFAMLLMFIVAWDALRGADAWTATLVGAVIAFGLSAPLMVGGSIQPQMDGSIGVICIAATSTCLYYSGRRMAISWSVALAALAGLIAGLGKNEWAMAMMGAGLAGLAGTLLVRHLTHDAQPPPMQAVVVFFCAVIAGVAAGSIISYAADSWNYLHGLDVLQRTQRATFAKWMVTFSRRWEWIWPTTVLVAGAFAIALSGWRRLMLCEFNQAVILIWSLALFTGFAISSWPGDNFPRYFCTSTFGLLFFLAIFLPRLKIPRLVKALATIALLAGLAVHINKLERFDADKIALGSEPGTSLPARAANLEWTRQEIVATKQLRITDISFGYYYPALDFITNAVPEDQARNMMKEYYFPRNVQ